MIKIQRISAPIELTTKVVQDKIAFFKADRSKNVWKEPYIESRLMEMTHGKCCYCECRLGEASNYMEVEHYHHKDAYPDEVVFWDNLLPACRACNGNKGAHDTVAEPIIKPTDDEPKDHFGFRDFRYKGKTDMGKETVILLNLNDTEKRCAPRFRICSELNSKVEDFLEDVKMITPASRTQERNRMTNKVRELLELCQCDREYTAIKATTMVNNDDYAALVTEMQARSLWTPDLEQLDAQMRMYALDLV